MAKTAQKDHFIKTEFYFEWKMLSSWIYKYKHCELMKRVLCDVLMKLMQMCLCSEFNNLDNLKLEIQTFSQTSDDLRTSSSQKQN